MDRKTKRHLPAFTLMEIMVVIVIILILVAVSVPIFRGVRSKARGAHSAQNLRQIGIGLHAYISQNSGRFPDGGADVSWAPNITTNRCWYDAAAENLGRDYVPFHKGDPLPAVFGCPGGHGRAYAPAWPYTGDYAANFYLGHPNHKVVNLSDVRNPTATPYVQTTVKQNMYGTEIYASSFSRTANKAFATNHGGKGNILWVDGHVTSLSYNDYMDMANDPKYGGVYNFIRGNWGPAP